MTKKTTKKNTTNKGMSPKEKKVVADLKKSMAKKDYKESMTVRLYVIGRRRKPFSFPFYAVSDVEALRSLKELSKQIPDIQRSNLYFVGTYCALDGKITSSIPILVLDK